MNAELSDINNLFQQPSLRGILGTVRNDFSDPMDMRLPIHKHAVIVEYLQKLKLAQSANFVDIFRELKIDLNKDYEVLSMLLSNPRIECEKLGNSDYNLRFLSKHNIRDKRELLIRINLIKNGISLADIQECYDGIVDDVMNAIVSGDIIAIKNRISKELILYPRMKAFLTRLSGNVQVTAGSNLVVTDNNLTNEIYRGEAICLDNSYWYRVSCATSNNENASNNAPTSVSLEKELPINLTRHSYVCPFTARVLPLDGAYEGGNVIIKEEAAASEDEPPPAPLPHTCSAIRHGCTNDIKALWNQTTEHLKPFLLTGTSNNNNDGIRLLNNELVRLNLISRSVAATVASGSNKRSNAPVETEARKRRKLKKSQAAIDAITVGHNTHLVGTTMGNILKETAQAIMLSNNNSK